MLSIPIEFDDLLEVVKQLSDEQKRILRDQLDSDIPQTEARAPKPRILGLHAGMISTSDDFDDP